MSWNEGNNCINMFIEMAKFYTIFSHLAVGPWLVQSYTWKH